MKKCKAAKVTGRRRRTERKKRKEKKKKIRMSILNTLSSTIVKRGRGNNTWR